MFSPAAPKSTLSRVRDGGGLSSPSTPLPHHSATPLSPSSRQPFSPATPWSHRSTIASRTPPLARILDKNATDESQPVFVSSFPQDLRTAQAEASPSQKTGACGGIEKKTGLSWMLQGVHLFVWSHLSSQSPEKCTILSIPSELCSADGESIDPKHGDNWLICLVSWEEAQSELVSFAKDCKSTGIIACSRKSLAVVYWPDIFAEDQKIVVSVSGSDSEDRSMGGLNRRLTSNWSGAPLASFVNSMVACAVTGPEAKSCVAIACRSSGELWRFDCKYDGIIQKRLGREVETGPSRGELSNTFFVWNSSCARSIVWRYSEGSPWVGSQQFLLLTATGIECWDIDLTPGGEASRAWSFDLLADLARDLVGQKQVWLLDLQVDAKGTVLKVLLASYSKDRVNSSSYTQYSLAILRFVSELPKREGGLQVILPKARIEEEEFLYSMRLRIGGKPEGSAMILAGDGTSTVAYYSAGTVRLYQFDLAWDAGKVLDATVMGSLEDGEEGTWLVLTEKAGVWAIPGKAVLYCGVEPPERSLSRRGSSSEGTAREERRQLAFGDSLVMRKMDSETGITGGKKEITTIRARPFHDEEAEALVCRLFHDFLSSGEAEGVLEKLERAVAFEREGEMNVFARTSKSLVDTLPKQWTASSVAFMAAISQQLLEKQHRFQQFLQFLAVSKCHEELQQRQRSALQVILEHGEKLAAMILLRELHNASAKTRLLNAADSPRILGTDTYELGGSLWDFVQLVGEKARRNNVMLMDREKAEVFYSRVSDLEDFFSCVYAHIDFVVGRELPLHSQIDRVVEISSACIEALRTAIKYRDTHHSWYPSPEGLVPWYCKPAVRAGLWKLAAFLLELKAEAAIMEPSMVSILISQLEGITEILLEAYAGAITAKVEREEEYRGLQTEYWEKRDTLLGALQQHAKGIAETLCQDALTEEQRCTVLKKVYGSLISLARRHAGYQTLWNICSDLNDMEGLRSLMHESMGLKEGRFSNFVFEQCLHNHQYGRLIRLGEEFQEELEAFLQSHKDLLWLHELYMQHFSLASSTLHSLALSKDETMLTMEALFSGNFEGGFKYGRLKLADRRRFLYLSKISALAGGAGANEAEDSISRIDADIGLLMIQDEAYKLGLATDDEFLSPRQLADVCLKSEDKDLVLCVFDVFALSGDSFRRSNRSLLQSAWLRAADLDNWTNMRQASEREGWSDEQHLQALQSTALFYASRRCYGEDSNCFGGTFHDALPLCQEDAEEDELFSSEVEMETVETTLTQHPDFPDAGHAMLTAIRMGRNMNDDLEGRVGGDIMLDV